jgi:hypothetical protein
VAAAPTTSGKKGKGKGKAKGGSAKPEAPAALPVAAEAPEVKAAVVPKVAEVEGVGAQQVAGEAAAEAPASGGVDTCVPAGSSDLGRTGSKSKRREANKKAYNARRKAAKQAQLAAAAGEEAPATEEVATGATEVAAPQEVEVVAGDTASVSEEVVSQPSSPTPDCIVEVVSSAPDSPRCVGGFDQAATPVVAVKVSPLPAAKVLLAAGEGVFSPRGSRPSSRCRSRSCSRGPVSRPASPAPATLEADSVSNQAADAACLDDCDVDAVVSDDAVCLVVAGDAPSVAVSRASSPSPLGHQECVLDQGVGHHVVNMAMDCTWVGDVAAEASPEEVSLAGDCVVVTLLAEAEVAAAPACPSSPTLDEGCVAEAPEHVVVDLLDTMYTGVVPAQAAVLGGTSGVPSKAPGLLQSLRGAASGLKGRVRSGLGRFAAKAAQRARAAVSGLAAAAWELVEWVVPLKGVISAWKAQGTAPQGV